MESIINNIIKQRRSIYPQEYNGNELDESIIQTLLENANYAPNHLSNYPWYFIVLKGNALKNWIDEAATIYKEGTSEANFKQTKYDKTKSYAQKVSHAIAIVMRCDSQVKSILNEDICAVAAAVQNMYLSLSQFEHAGGYWSTGLGTYSDRMHKYLELSDSETLLGFFLLGEVDNKRTEGNRKDFNHFVKYL